jgi:hypothetical protein
MKKLLPLILLTCCCMSAFSQRDVDERTSWSVKDRGYLGLGFGGLGFGTNSQFGTYFSVGVSPQAGYMLTKNLSTGLAFEYQYTSYSDLHLKNHMYGWYPFVRYNIIKDFFLQADYDWYSIDNVFTPETDRVTFDRFFVGVGYSSRGGGRSAVNFLASYDLLYTNTSPFNSPLSIRIFMTF